MPARHDPHRDFRIFVLDQLHELGAVDARRMFGGYGLYHQGTFFAILSNDTLYFKTSESSRQAYIDRGMEPFRPTQKMTLKTYYEVPVEILEDATQLAAWARLALEAQAGSDGD